jgi:hypothetical protein
MNDFEKWWYEIGSGIGALHNHDHEEHGMRISKLAWEKASYQLRKERDLVRRMYCHMAAQVMYKSDNKSTAEHIADSKNWDCYKTETQEETK